MANCPKCNKSVPWHKHFTHTKWTGIRCDGCRAELFIKRSKSFNFFVYFVPTIIACIIVSNFVENLITKVILLVIFILLMFLIDATIIWGKTKLDIRDESPKQRRD